MLHEILMAIQASKASAEVCNGIVNGYKIAQEILNNIKDIDKDENLLELRKFLFESKKRELALVEHCFSLEQQLKSIKLELHQKQSFKFNGIIFKDEEGNSYCPACYQSKDPQAILLLHNEADEDEAWKCPVCKLSLESKEATLRRRKRLNQITSQRTPRSF
jgi:rubredoxin